MKTSAQRDYWVNLQELATKESITFDDFKNKAKIIIFNIIDSYVTTDDEKSKINKELDKIDLKQFDYDGCKIIY